MKLHQTTSGEGSDLVLLHGWGMSSLVWQELVESLQDSFRVTCVDLPGHGLSPCVGVWSIEDVVHQLVEQLPQRFCLLGWSLGGMLALKLAAQHPERVEKLMMLASSAKFVRAESWAAAQTKEVLQQFAEQLRKDSKATIKRFMLLQTQGVNQPEKITKQLNALLTAQQLPSHDGLQSGLSVLQEVDLRPELAELKVPVAMLLGEKDKLIPQAAGELSQSINEALALYVIKGASHVPFLSHKKETKAQINRFFLRNEP